jgi:hypothetical protein
MKGRSIVSFVAITLLLMGVMVVPTASACKDGFPVGTSSLRIFCFYDANGNGVYDNPVPVWVNNALVEWVQGGWKITVRYGSYSQDFITDCEGVVKIPNIKAGTYIVTQYAGPDCGCGCIEYCTTTNQLLSNGGDPKDHLSQVVNVKEETNLVIGNLCFCPLGGGGHTVDWWSTSTFIEDSYLTPLNALNLYDPEHPRASKVFSSVDSVKEYLKIGDPNIKYRLSAQIAAFRLDILYTMPEDLTFATWDGVQDFVIINLGLNYKHPTLATVPSILTRSDFALLHGNRELQLYWLKMLEGISTDTFRMVSWSSCWAYECPMP